MRKFSIHQSFKAMGRMDFGMKLKNMIKICGWLQFFLVSCFILLAFSSRNSIAGDTITLNQTVIDGKTLVSSGGNFEFGFFSPNNSNNRYLGIWYKRIPVQTIVWVANRDDPITDSSGILKLSKDGNLVLLNQSETVVWSTNVSKAENPVAQLLDSGNLVVRVRDNDSSNFLWQSFDHPTDTLLPGMKLGWNLKTGLNRFLTSWKNDNDPSTGNFVFGVDLRGYPQPFIWNGKIIEYRSGPWNGLQFSAVPEMMPNLIFDFNFTSTADELYYSFSLKNDSILSRLMMSPSGKLQRFTMLEDQKNQSWNLYWFAPKDQCDNYKACGAYGICDASASLVCECPIGFKPRNPQNWYLRDGSGGCVRETEIGCLNGDYGFLKLPDMKVPDTSQAFVNESMSLQECEAACRRNCSCTAYANSKVTKGVPGCLYWTGDLMDLRVYSDGGQDLYLRMAASDLAKSQHSEARSSRRKQLMVGLIVSVCVGVFVLVFSGCFLWKKIKINGGVSNKKTGDRVSRLKGLGIQFDELHVSRGREYSDEYNKDDVELPLLDFATIATSTDNFSEANKLGKGGFGIVYKGKLEGQEIAVKRLSKNSGQGQQEFMNEVMLIAKLQHRNLVRLLGSCIDGEEKMLIYEYMQNRSLDSLLFDKGKSSSLDWAKRFQIIGGIARGILYLHQDSRFRIIHRDLKASNILLDGEMNPKVSDFGMARIFGDDNEANTKRVVGTYGYMSPEYAMDGIFSVKSDVFSFGVLVLEIVSGEKNRGFYYVNSEFTLLAHAWRLWKEGKGLELMDESMKGSCSADEVLRCIQVGLLCVQELAEERPTMSSVVLMLSCETTTMPQPKFPGFGHERIPLEICESSSKQESRTINPLTLSMVESR
ncbi:hypothetical protein NE237_032042 [Protea cynaroides]|uniref:Receptor-like serine/threonine-protein kinase n=1 Tax=Protea cynaroides TaxID=273540 RepID=A0A9Q0R2Q1_9MAGN|nr:hypothetical protein NE237_032042 [Protea cynaroides]